MEARAQGLGGYPSPKPINLKELDAKAQVEMNSLIMAGVRFGAGIVRFDKGEPVIRLGEAIGKRLVAGTARQGVKIEDLCRGMTASGRVREGLVEPVRDVVDLASRAILAVSRRPAIHEWVASVSVKAGEDSHAIGVDRHPNFGTRAHVLLGAIGASDRQVLGQAEWLKKGTRDDHTDKRADFKRIERFKAQLRMAIPGPFHEHLRRMFEAEDRARAMVVQAAKRGSPLFAECGIDAEKFLKYYFPICLILGSVPYGPPEKRAAGSAGVLLPGDDDVTVAVVEDAGRHGVARCTLGEPEISLDALQKVLLPELGERFGEHPEPVPQSELDAVAVYPPSSDLRIVEDLPSVRYWWLEKSGRLLRSKQISGPDGAEVLDVELWRTIRLDGKLLCAAIALIERAHQPWAFSCIARFGREFEPGLAHTWKAVPREGLLRASLIPNAAGVCAYREMERRQMGR